MNNTVELTRTLVSNTGVKTRQPDVETLYLFAPRKGPDSGYCQGMVLFQDYRYRGQGARERPKHLMTQRVGGFIGIKSVWKLVHSATSQWRH